MNCILIQSIIAIYGCTVLLGLRKKHQTLYLPICQAGHEFGNAGIDKCSSMHKCKRGETVSRSVPKLSY